MNIFFVLLLLLFCSSFNVNGVLVRRNILSLTPHEQQIFVDTILKLKHEINPLTNISTYDSYVISHNVNSPYAHLGPAFLPWHRKFLLNFEADARRISGFDNFTLPYWDWTNNLTRMSIWTPSLMGGNGTVTPDSVSGLPRVVDGPFNDKAWKVTYERDLAPAYDGIHRAWGTPLGDMPDMHHDMGNSSDAPVLPDIKELMEALVMEIYDTPPWNDSSHNPPSFRNSFEGWEPTGCRLHNTVHLWVGGHMRQVAISVNDPVFWLHHAFVDKVFDIWQRWHGWSLPWLGYLPLSGARVGHNLNDEMVMTPFPGGTVKDALDMTKLGYVYEDDVLDEAVREEQRATMIKIENAKRETRS